jgi:hypothetical protein
MKTEKLIHQLARRAQPVTPIGRPITRLTLWLLFATAFMFVAVHLVGARLIWRRVRQRTDLLLYASSQHFLSRWWQRWRLLRFPSRVRIMSSLF